MLGADEELESPSGPPPSSLNRVKTWVKDTRMMEHAIDHVPVAFLDQYLALFREFDQNNDGFVDEGEFVAAMTKLMTKNGQRPTRNSLVSTFASIDADNDGYLSRSDFVAFLESMRLRGLRKARSMSEKDKPIVRP